MWLGFDEQELYWEKVSVRQNILASVGHWFSKRGPGPSNVNITGNVSEMHILEPHSRSTESETPGVGLAGDSDGCSNLGISARV